MAATPEGRLLRVNPCMAAMLGFGSPEELTQSCADEMRRLWDDPADWDAFASLLAERGEVAQYPAALRRSGGAVLPCTAWARLAAWPWAGGRAVEVVVRSEVERHQAFAVLTQVLRLSRDMMDLNPDPLFIHEQGCILLANPAAESFFHRPERGALVGRTPGDLLDPRCLGDVRRHLRATAAGRFVERELRLVLADGGERWVRDFSTAVTFRGRPAVLTLLHDRTGRREAEQALAETHGFYRTLADNLPEAVCLHDSGRILYANARLRELFAPQQTGDLGGRRLVDFLHPDSLPTYERRKATVLAGQGETFEEFPLRFADGRWRHVSEKTVPVAFRSERVFLVIIRDVTGQVATQQALAEAESLYRTIVETSPAPIFIYNPEGLLYANPALARFYRVGSVAELMRMSIDDLVDEESAARIKARIKALHEGTADEGSITTIRLRNGEVRYSHASTVGITYQGRPCLLTALHDLTAHRQAEAERDQALARYEGLFESAPMGLAMGLPAGGYRRVNRRMAEMFGYPSPEAMVREVTDIAAQLFFSPGDFARMLDQVRRQGAVQDFECLRRRRDGSLFWAAHSGRVVRDAAGQVSGFESFVRDISALRKAQEESEERGRRVRVLARELARASERERRAMARDLHDGPVQLLALATMMVEDLRQCREQQPGKFDTPLKLLREAADMLRSTVADLAPPALFADGLAEALASLGSEFLARYSLAVAVCCPNLPALSREARSFLFRAARELLVNAVKHGRARQASLRVEVWDRELTLTVEDGGAGFDPGLGAGSGRASHGLPGLRSLARDLGGRLVVDSAPGTGARVVLTLPLNPLYASQPLLD